MSSFLGNLHRAVAPVDAKGSATPSNQGPFAQSLTDLESTFKNGLLISPADLPAYIDGIRNLNGVGMNDREGLLEKLVVVMSRLPADNEMGQKMQKLFVDALYNDLPHPPQGFMSDFGTTTQPTEAGGPSTDANTGTGNQGDGYEVKGAKRPAYIFRTDDGSSYNPLIPDLGKAGAPYSRSVPNTTPTPASALPDPGLLFDTLLKRPDNQPFKEHPGDLSALFFAVADIVIHNVFDTDHANPAINQTSSYLDLAPLYGGGTKTVFEGGHCLRMPVHEIRKFDGTGMIWEDCFADARLLGMPPAVGVILVLLNRNHNHIAQKILSINEKKSFVNPDTLDDESKRAQDDELFHRARLVNCAYFGQVVLGDYVGGILGLVRDGSPWRLNLLQALRDGDHQLAPRGDGASVSVEFNMLYRWHATTSASDSAWIGAMFNEMFDNKPYDQITTKEFAIAAAKKLVPDRDLRKWTVPGLQRGADGKYSDAALAAVLQTATEQPAHAFGARSTPQALRVIEIMAIQHQRAWGCCTMNEFRSFFGLKPYANFQEWNPNPEIWKAAEALYGNIENLELHIGLQAEETKSPMPGAGLCPGYTIARAILADAVCLCRGDRFLTTELTPHNLTAWGFQDVMVNTEDGSYGGMLTKLFYRTLPDEFPRGSAYAHFPLLVPAKMRAAVAKNHPGDVDKYIWTRPNANLPSTSVELPNEVRQVLGDRRMFCKAREERLMRLVKGVGRDADVINRALCEDDTLRRFASVLNQITTDLVREKTIGHIDANKKYVDVVKDVINLAPVYFLANEVLGLPLKTAANPHGIYREHELYEKFAEISSYVLVNSDRYDDWELRERSSATAADVIAYVTAHLDKIKHGILSLSGFKDTVSSYVTRKTDNSDVFLTRWHALAGADAVHGEMAASLFAEVVPSAADYSAALAHVVEYFLAPERRELVKQVGALCRGGAGQAEVEATMVGYIREALRANPPVGGVCCVAKMAGSVGAQSVTAGQAVYANILRANENLTTLPPLTGGADSVIYGLGEQGMMATKFFEKTAPAVLAALFALKDVQPGPGTSGAFTCFTEEVFGTSQRMYIDLKGHVTPWPASLILQVKMLSDDVKAFSSRSGKDDRVQRPLASQPTSSRPWVRLLVCGALIAGAYSVRERESLDRIARSVRDEIDLAWRTWRQ